MGFYWEPGTKFVVSRSANTDLICKLGFNPNLANGWVTFVDIRWISFFLQSGEGRGYIEAKCELTVFGQLFEKYRPEQKASAYVRSKHFMKVFPRDFAR